MNGGNQQERAGDYPERTKREIVAKRLELFDEICKLRDRRDEMASARGGYLEGHWCNYFADVQNDLHEQIVALNWVLGDECVKLETQHLPIEFIRGKTTVIIEATLAEDRNGMLNAGWRINGKESGKGERLTPEEATYIAALINQSAAKLREVYGYVPPPE